MDNANEQGGERRPGPPSEERVRLELVLFADLIQRLESENRLAEALPFVIEDPDEREARRVVREMEERKREMMEEWGESWTPDEDEGSGS